MIFHSDKPGVLASLYGAFQSTLQYEDSVTCSSTLGEPSMNVRQKVQLYRGLFKGSVIPLHSKSHRKAMMTLR